MFHWPYRFRRQTQYIIPKGPSIISAPRLRTEINGTEVSLKVPGNRTLSPVEPRHPRKQYHIRDGHFNRALTGQPEWESLPLIARWWDYNGPWFTGKLAELSMFVSVMKPLHPNPDASFFHPRALEAAVADLLTYYHGNELSRDGTVQDWFAPVSWQPLTHLPCIAARFDCSANREVRRDELERHVILPLSDQYLLKISFSVWRSPPYIYPDKGPEKDTDKWISEEPMKAMTEQLIDSLRISMSPEALQQQAKALEGLRDHDKALVGEYPPLRWV